MVRVETIIGLKMGHVTTSHAHKVCSFPFSWGATHNAVPVHFHVVDQVYISLQTFNGIAHAWLSHTSPWFAIRAADFSQSSDQTVLEVMETHPLGVGFTCKGVQDVRIGLADLK